MLKKECPLEKLPKNAIILNVHQGYADIIITGLQNGIFWYLQCKEHTEFSYVSDSFYKMHVLYCCWTFFDKGLYDKITKNIQNVLVCNNTNDVYTALSPAFWKKDHNLPERCIEKMTTTYWTRTKLEQHISISDGQDWLPHLYILWTRVLNLRRLKKLDKERYFWVIQCVLMQR